MLRVQAKDNCGFSYVHVKLFAFRFCQQSGTEDGEIIWCSDFRLCHQSTRLYRWGS